MTALVFDLDGTLVHTLPDITHAANAALAPTGAQPIPEDKVRRMIGRGTDALLHAAIAETGADPAEFDAIRARYLSIYADATEHSHLFDGVAEALTTLADRGHVMGLCTNKPETPTASVLRRFDLSKHFAAVVAGDTLPVAKPDPAPLHETLARMSAATCLYVGDSETDAETAARANMPFALFTGGYRKTPATEIDADWRFDRWSDFISMLDDWTRAGNGAVERT